MQLSKNFAQLGRGISRANTNWLRYRSTMSAPLDASKLEIIKTSSPKPIIAKENLVFGKSFTNHMVEIEWTKQEGWGAPRILPYHNFAMDPATVVFHYGFELFEGMKAYRDANDQIRTFRGDKNMTRMNTSAARIALPTFDGEELMKVIDKFLTLDSEFIPGGDGYSLYIRPTMIGTTAALGVGPPDRALLYVIASPVGSYYGKGFKPVTLEATDYAVRAWPGGVGNKKLGANYAPCIVPQIQASQRGYDQNLWLFGEEGYITEVGMMNVFFVFKNDDGTKELVTAPLDGTILEGVTRDSVIELCRERLPSSEWTVSERKFTIKEVKERAEKGQLVEAFGSGTAAVVSPISRVGWRGEDIEIPLAAGTSGELAKDVAQWINKIQYGQEEFRDWSRVAK